MSYWETPTPLFTSSLYIWFLRAAVGVLPQPMYKFMLWPTFSFKSTDSASIESMESVVYKLPVPFGAGMIALSALVTSGHCNKTPQGRGPHGGSGEASSQPADSASSVFSGAERKGCDVPSSPKTLIPSWAPRPLSDLPRTSPPDTITVRAGVSAYRLGGTKTFSSYRSPLPWSWS